MKKVLLIAVLGVSLLASVAPGAMASDVDFDVSVILNKAERARDLTCREFPTPKPRRVSLTAAAPNAGLVGALGVLRRPQTSEEQALTPVGGAPSDERWFLLASEGYATATRIVTVEAGLRAYITIGRTDTSYLLSKRKRQECNRKYRAAVVRLSARSPREVRNKALREVRRLSNVPAPKVSRDFLEYGFFVDGKRWSGGGGPSTAKDLRRTTGFIFDGTGATGGKGARVLTLVPDGVDAVAVTSTVHGVTTTVTAPVHENVAIARLDDPAMAQPNIKITWKRADGSVVQPSGR